MMDQTHEEIAELLGVYALDAVDVDERDAVETHLVACPRCAAEVADHREVAATMAYTGAPAPAGLWTKIVESLEEPPPEMTFLLPTRSAFDADVADVDRPGEVADLAAERAARRPTQWIPAGAVAAALVVVAMMAGVFIGSAQTDDAADPQITLPEATIDDIARRVLNDPGSSKVALASLTDDSLQATAAFESDGSGYLLGTSLPALGEDMTYQLWGVRSDAVISLGVLGHAPGVIAFHLDDSITSLVITAEVDGGVPQSANPALLIGNVV